MIVLCFCRGLIEELCRAVTALVNLGADRSDGQTYREFLESISDISDVEEKLHSDEVSRGAEYLWSTYWEIKSACGNGMTNSITWAVLRDWSVVMGRVLRRWEVRGMLEIDRAFSAAQSELKKSE